MLAVKLKGMVTEDHRLELIAMLLLPEKSDHCEKPDAMRSTQRPGWPSLLRDLAF